MSKINILSSEIYNKIAAGEVVERPSSVVKELVENALDAGAKNIIISIKKGGKSYIQVSDDGGGMEPEDVKKAFYPHATSKISQSNDLFDLQTLGFRGEALASISSVSMVTIKSRDVNFQTGVCLSVSGGVEQDYKEIACNVGTDIVVSNLFFNTPARLKFLKKDTQEEHEITNLVGRYILINHNVAFKYIVDDIVIYQTSGKGLRDAIFIVYGKDTVNNLIEVSNEYKGMSVQGYISKPTYFKSNKNYQTVSLNSRYIINSQVAVAVNNAYSDYLMKRSYPFYVLEISMPNSAVDVNVHPNKMDVRFENSQDVFKMIYGSVSYAINEFNKARLAEITQDFSEKTIQPSIENDHLTMLKNKVNIDNEKLDGHYSSGCLRSNEIAFDFSSKVNDSKEYSASIEDIAKKAMELKPVSDTQHKIKKRTAQENMPLPISYTIIGQVFNTYILVECQNLLYFIDQHAAHERFLYDKIMLKHENFMQIQDLLLPYVFNVSYSENEFFKGNLNTIATLGFTIEEFGQNAYKVTSVPMYFSSDNVGDFIKEILHDVKNINKINDIEILKNNFAQKACKAAIKAGKQLSDNEIHILIKNIQAGQVLQCPHGRPIIMSFTKTDIEKLFKRIV